MLHLFTAVATGIQRYEYFVFGRCHETVHLFNRAFCYHGYLVLAKENGQECPHLDVGEEVARALALPSKTKGYKGVWVPALGPHWAEPLWVKPTQVEDHYSFSTNLDKSSNSPFAHRDVM